MMIKAKSKAPARAPASAIAATLGDVVRALESQQKLPGTRLRDACSAVRRVARLLGDEPAHILLDVPTISTKLATISPAAAGLTAKSLNNIRSDFMAAVRASGLKSIPRSPTVPLSAKWKRLMAKLFGKRAHIGLSRLARYASANDLEPENINDAAILAFIAEVRTRTLHRKPNGLHRKVAQIWNEIAEQSELGLKPVNVPSFRSPAKRIDWKLLPSTFRKDHHNYLTWCAGDPLASDARSRPLAPQTIKLRRDHIHAAVTALVESGTKPKTIKSLADVVSSGNFKRIVRRRHELVEGRENVFNRDLARSLIEIARQWVEMDAASLAELNRLASKIPTPISGLTDKNKRALRQFDDPAVLRRLYDFPNRLWAELKRDAKPDFRTLVKAQAAIAVAILSYMPIRLQNLAALTFDLHLFLHEGPGAISSLELSAGEVKNRRELAFDILPQVTKMLIEYRTRIAPKVIGHRPDRLFVRADGTPKNQWSVAWLIRTYLKRRAGIALSSHQFRHLSAQVMLSVEPGNFEALKQLLGHKSLQTTVNAYAGIDSRRAGRHHQRLIAQALADETPAQRQQGAARR